MNIIQYYDILITYVTVTDIMLTHSYLLLFLLVQTWSLKNISRGESETGLSASLLIYT